MRGSIWTLAVVAIFSGVFAMSAINAAVPSSPASSTQATVDILSVTSPVVGMLLFLVGIGAAWVIAVSRSTF